MFCYSFSSQILNRSTSEKITNFHVSAARACDPHGLARIVGCHGQTVSHRPPTDSSKGASLQLIQAPLLATLIGTPVIFDLCSGLILSEYLPEGCI